MLPATHTFSSPLEEEPNNEHLQSSHSNHHANLNDTKIEDPLLGTPNRAEIPILPRAEVFLVTADGGQLGGELEDGFFEDGGLFWGGSLFGWELCALLVLDLRVARC
jgi:hypothetical protein